VIKRVNYFEFKHYDISSEIRRCIEDCKRFNSVNVICMNGVHIAVSPNDNELDIWKTYWLRAELEEVKKENRKSDTQTSRS